MKMDIYQKLEEKLGHRRIRVNEPLSLHTTFQIGGPADFYYEAGTVGELVKVVEVVKDLGIPYFILGGGSNILVGDKGFRGLVIKNKSKNIKILGYKGKIRNSKSEIRNVLVEADSGVPFNQLVRFTVEEGLGGLEEFLGLPGTVGGAVVSNAHWQEKHIEDLIVSKKFFEKTLLSVVFSLKKEDKETLWQKAKEAAEYRQKTQPAGASAGCIFKNIKKSEAARIGTPDLTMSAGFLIEASGLKGKKVGEVQISPKHANFIINLSADKAGLGGAKAVDVLNLISLVKTKVKEKFRLDLEEEILKVGEF